MPFPTTIETYPIIELARRVRQNPVAAYGVALCIVALATLVRWALTGTMMDATPFITYFPAIIIVTLLAGFWPGILAVLLSTAIGWYLFLPPVYSFDLDSKRAVFLLLFVFVAIIDVFLVVLLNTAVDRAIAHEQNVRALLENAPSSILVVDEQGAIKLVNASAEKLFGYERIELLGKSVEVLVPDRHGGTHRAERETFLQSPEARPMGIGRDLSGRRKDGSEFPIEIGLNPISRNAPETSWPLLSTFRSASGCSKVSN